MIESNVMQNDAGKWEVAYRSTRGPMAERGWMFEAESPQFDTRREAEDQKRWEDIQSANERAAERRYQGQIAYVMGERD